MSRYIDAEKLVERIKASPVFPNMGEDGYFLRGCVCDLIDMQPTADVQLVKHGKWLEKKYGFACSNCRKRAGSRYGISGAYLSNYCPHCGAKMDGKESKA